MNHVMLDLETFGTGRDAAIASIGACVFDPVQDMIETTFHRRIDLGKSVKMGQDIGRIDASTVEWWLQQSEEARKDVVSGERTDLLTALNMFRTWISDFGDRTRDIRLWSNGPTFDETILRDAYTRFGLEFPFHYRSSRCCRTIFDLAKSAGFIPRGRTEGLRHSAVDDAVYQARGVCAMWSYLSVDRTHSAKLVEGAK